MTRALNLVQGAIIACALVMRLATTPSANLSFILLAGFALFGRAQAIQALALSWLFSMVSPGLAAEATLSSIGRYTVILGAALSVLLRSGLMSRTFSLSAQVFLTLMLGVFFVTHSLLFSPFPDVSILKAVSWTLVVATTISAWGGLGPVERMQLVEQLFKGLTILLIVSLPLLVSPLGYLRNGSGFQGVLGHPQAFGPTIALLGAWSASRMFASPRPPWMSIVLVGACLALVVLSEARTAGVGLVLAMGLAIIMVPALSGERILTVMPGLRSKRVWTVLVVVAMAGIVMAPRVAEITNSYITKFGRAEEVTGLASAYEQSRGRLIDLMWANIKSSPLTGIGFGIASHPALMKVERDPYLGLPVGAPIEKGVMPLAVLEEVGIIGFILVAFWLWMMLRRAARGGIAPLAVITTALLLNLGESIFFSPGGMGMLLLVLVGWAFACGRRAQPA